MSTLSAGLFHIANSFKMAKVYRDGRGPTPRHATPCRVQPRDATRSLRVPEPVGNEAPAIMAVSNDFIPSSHILRSLELLFYKPAGGWLIDSMP